MSHARLRIGAGAGFSGDRIEPAVELAEKGDLDYLVFECLAERTIALAQLARRNDPDNGFDPYLRERMEAVLKPCHARGVRIISNMGAANPVGAARATAAAARKLGLGGLKIAAVTGDDVLDLIVDGAPLFDHGGKVADLRPRLVSANAYMGSEGIIAALAADADVVLTGRVGDPALFLAPMMHHFGWAADDWDRLGQGTVIGHLLECAGQITGGYFADPGVKDVPDLAHLGFPIAEIEADGQAVLSKVAGSGGRLDVATCKEQLLYEILDPAAYIQPDAVADLTGVRFEPTGPDRVRVRGGRGRQRPDRLKVTLGYSDGYIGEGQMSYAGPGAVARAQLALDIVRQRLDPRRFDELRFDLIGVNAVTRTRAASHPACEPAEVRIRVAGRTGDAACAAQIGREVEALYTNGPSGGGGAFTHVRSVMAVASTLIDRHGVTPRLHMEVA
jgi:hypothetical protein